MSTWGCKKVTPATKPIAKRIDLKFHKAPSHTSDTLKLRIPALKKKKNNKCMNAWKELKMLLNKATSKIPRAPAVLSPIKRCSTTSKIPPTPRTTKRTETEFRLQQRCSNSSTRRPEDISSKAPKTSLLTKKRNSKRVVLNEENKTVSKWKGQQNTRRGVKKHVDHVLPRNDSTATSTRSVSVTNSMVSPFVTNQRTIIAPKRQFIDGNSSSFSSFSTGQESRCSIGFRDESVGKDPETGECSEENHAACDPPVLSRINEAWREGRISAEASSSKHNTFELSTTQDEAFVKAANLDLTDECGRCLSACAQASQAADRLLEEINFIQDSKPMRRRRDKIPSWIREHYEASTATGRNSTGRCSTGRSSSSGLSSSRSIKTMMKRSNSVVESKTKSTRIKRGMQDSPMDAVMPLGASYYMDNFTRRQRGFNQQTENLDHELKAFLNLRGQTPTNFSGTWMHQLQTLAERDLEAPLQAELRVCLARLAKLEFENRALKELVLLKCGLPKQIGIHKSNSSGASSVLSEDLENYNGLDTGLPDRRRRRDCHPITIDSVHELFMND